MIDLAKYKKMGKCNSIVAIAVHNGSLPKPTQCSQCTSEIDIEGHHPDYNKPLEVVWLCHECHSRLHYPNAQPRKYKTEGNKLKMLRRDLGLSPTELAVHLGVTTSSVCSWESGQRLPRLGMQSKISRLLARLERRANKVKEAK